ncbi:MAG: glutamine--fructose-6-phosphate transaminase (isomerizing) [Candidatus Kerfeldbacteria bacterium]|nr:glutamine--fructose-6-phosphate transaminase (isomerizing) [Candidatus Kerfeldbacteria bacterium]
MCGIIGYVGKRPAQNILLDGLKRLEYRGYDSAGIAVLEHGKLTVEKNVGRILELEAKLGSTQWASTIGMAHTRWATHGKPSTANAHPHVDHTGKLALIHNGIIENYRELRKELEKKGIAFQSQTDTEVLVNLISDLYTGDLRTAVQEALKLVRGTYGIVVLHEDHPGMLITARNGSPIVLGLGDGENFVASDVTAMVAHTKNVVYLEDGEIAELHAGTHEIRTIGNETVTREASEVAWSIKQAERQGYEHFMLKEIFEEPEAMRNAMRGRVIPSEGLAKLGGLNLTEDEMRDVRRIVIIACGTAYYAGTVGEYFLEHYARIPTEVEFASEFRYNNPVLDEHTLVFAVSQSGETADTLAALREAQRKGVRVLGIINVVGSTIARESNGGVYIHSGPEIGVASTKAFIGQITAFLLIAFQFGRLRTMSQQEGIELANELIVLPEKIERALAYANRVKEIAKHYASYKNFFYLGRGANYPIALEGALKLKEISYLHSEAYPTAEMKHGPIAMIDENFPTVVIVPNDLYYEKNISNIEEIRARSGKILAVTTEGHTILEEYADDVLYVPETLHPLYPFLTIVPLHLLAYEVAVDLQRDVDKPRNLAKSVTVE